MRTNSRMFMLEKKKREKSIKSYKKRHGVCAMCLGNIVFIYVISDIFFVTTLY